MIKPCGMYFLQNYNAKLSGFGLAKWGPSDGESSVETRVMDTYGYAAPEYIATGNDTYNLYVSTQNWACSLRKGLYVKYVFSLTNSVVSLVCLTGHLNAKSDVYSFGVVLLELLTGLRVIDKSRSSGKQNLVDWAKPLLSHKRKLETFMDAKIKDQYSSKEALQIANITQKCLVPDPNGRPSMKEIVDALEQIQAISEISK